MATRLSEESTGTDLAGTLTIALYCWLCDAPATRTCTVCGDYTCEQHGKHVHGDTDHWECVIPAKRPTRAR